MWYLDCAATKKGEESRVKARRHKNWVWSRATPEVISVLSLVGPEAAPVSGHRGVVSRCGRGDSSRYWANIAKEEALLTICD